MLSINNSYFDPILCTDGHYIITGRTNDQFCLDTLELTDILPALHAYLRYEQGFDAVFFFDSYNMLYCMDRASYAILTGRAPAAAPAPAPHGGAISAGGPLGRRRRRPAPAPAPAPGPDPDPQQGNTGPLNLGRMSMGSAWQQVSSIMQRSDQRCALVIANANLMQGGEMLMTELNTFRSARHSVVISIFRETTIQNVSQWDSFARSVLEPRMNTNDPERNRVISLPSPNCREIRNLLNHFRIEPSPRLRVEPGDIPVLGQRLAESCARNNWGLTDLITRLTSYATRQGEILSLRNWRAFIGEENRRPALERLAAAAGLQWPAWLPAQCTPQGQPRHRQIHHCRAAGGDLLRPGAAAPGPCGHRQRGNAGVPQYRRDRPAGTPAGGGSHGRGAADRRGLRPVRKRPRV